MLFDVVTRLVGFADPAAYVMNGLYLIFRLLNVDGVTYDYRYYELRFSSYPNANPSGFGGSSPNTKIELGFTSPYSGSQNNLEYIAAWGYGAPNPPSGTEAIDATPVPFRKTDVDVMADCYGFNERPLSSEDITVDFPVSFLVNVSTYPAGYQRVLYVSSSNRVPVEGSQVETGKSMVQVNRGNQVQGLVPRCILYGNPGSTGQNNGKYLYREYIEGVTPINLPGYTFSAIRSLQTTVYNRQVTGYRNSHVNYPYAGIYDVGSSKLLYSSGFDPYPPALSPEFVYEPSYSLWGDTLKLSGFTRFGDRGNGPEAVQIFPAGLGHNLLDAGREPTLTEISNSKKLFTAG